MALELFDEPKRTLKSDVYAFGCVYIEARSSNSQLHQAKILIVRDQILYEKFPYPKHTIVWAIMCAIENSKATEDLEGVTNYIIIRPLLLRYWAPTASVRPSMDTVCIELRESSSFIR